jgi:hypothetical protein
MRVEFRGTPAANGTYTVGADGVPVQVEERQVTLAFDPGTGLSNAEVFRARGGLPDQIGVHATKLDWYVREQPAPSPCRAGSSTHRLCTTWRAMTPNGQQELHRWVYRPLMEWTCEWAAGQDNEKDICDAIIRNVGPSRLRYGQPLRVRGVRALLQNGGGMCGDWYRVFQQMAHCQGVFVHCRCFRVDWRRLPNNEELWCAIVIRRGGLNQAQPPCPASEFHDNDAGFPIATPVALATRFERRYRFWGKPGEIYDGHCVNFLEYRGRVYLYDACFGAGPFRIDSGVPAADPNAVVGGPELSSFKAEYLDGAVDYMLGSLYNGTAFHESVYDHVLHHAVANGMTVRTRDVPEAVYGGHGITFRWVE